MGWLTVAFFDLTGAVQERFERVGRAFDLLDSAAFDRAKVDDLAIGGGDLYQIRAVSYTSSSSRERREPTS